MYTCNFWLCTFVGSGEQFSFIIVYDKKSIFFKGIYKKAAITDLNGSSWLLILNFKWAKQKPSEFSAKL